MRERSLSNASIKSVEKMQLMLGLEAEAAALANAVVSESNMENKKLASTQKAMEKSGTALAEGAEKPPESGGCCAVQ